MLHTHLGVLALAATALVVSSCGGSSKSIPTHTTGTTTGVANTAPATVEVVKVASGTPLASSQWIAKVDAICAHVNAQLVATKLNGSDPSEFARALPLAVAYERAALVQLAKLVPPAANTGDWQQFLNGTQRVADVSEKLAESARAGKVTLGQPLAIEAKKIRQHISSIARRDGFKECSH